MATLRELLADSDDGLLGDVLQAGPTAYRGYVRAIFEMGEIDMYGAVRMLFNAGLRGRALALR